ncbi:Gfo/Idh/MocA family protein [Cohnella herbarum]|uniref:Gfo/Idh/MocA family oxidoreductase n=1 Tax=Cohnella herbarum TaxID=2728023 RepID=A0A7Z2VNW9_9BACL|nr:Gfo/Idh/MocA family oxidoreductase [Cohnella herbarum]QJD86432.1 Gfo/Idh/MocA family oxidoreductase [Cohnella herbarum]
MKPITAILIGAGGRGAIAYAPYAERYPHQIRFVAVAEPDDNKRNRFAQRYDLDENQVFRTWEHILEQSKLADIAIICTQDRMHAEPAKIALAKGYHVLLEKPMSPEPKECIEMEQAAKEHGRLLTVCHVLRYTPFWQTLKRIVQSGDIGDIASVQLNENVGFYHYAHSFVRGNWRDSEQSSPMILAKSSHDMDILAYLIDQPCVRVSSFGSLTHFNEAHAPAGSTNRCLDGCAVESTCAYSAPRFYLGEEDLWARLITTDPSREGIIKALADGPYGRCVYKSDNNVVDHQVVNLEFANGATATFSMCGFTHDTSRSIQVMGTKGEIRGYMENNEMTVYRFATKEKQHISVNVPANGYVGHGGGDDELMRSFISEVRNFSGLESRTGATVSVMSHMMAFAAEHSRLNHGMSVELKDYYELVAR